MEIPCCCNLINSLNPFKAAQKLLIPNIIPNNPTDKSDAGSIIMVKAINAVVTAEHRTLHL